MLINSSNIRQLDKKVKELKKEKRKIRFRKGLCGLTFAGIILGSSALPSVFGIAVGSFNYHSPFKRDVIVKEAHIKTEFNSNNGVEVSKQYDEYKKEKNELRYYTGWEKTPDDKYISNVITYDASNLTYSDVDKIINGEIKLNEPIKEDVLHKEYVSENHLNEGPYYEGVIYSIDSDDCIKIVQTKEENKTDLINFLYLPFVFGTPIGVSAFLNFKKDIYGILGPKFDPERNCRNIESVNRDIRNTLEKKKRLVKELR